MISMRKERACQWLRSYRTLVQDCNTSSTPSCSFLPFCLSQVRGVSGGERKRVSIAEALVSNARLVCLDEISTGLDSSITYDIVSCISAWVRERTRERTRERRRYPPAPLCPFLSLLPGVCAHPLPRPCSSAAAGLTAVCCDLNVKRRS